MPNPWLIIIMLLLMVGALFGVGKWQNNAGHVAERVIWQGKANKELSDANAEIQRLNDVARATEQKNAAAQAQIVASYEQEKQNDVSAKDILISQLRAGTLQLRDPGATSCVQTCGSVAGQVTSSTSGNNDRAPGELSEQFAEFLIQQDSLADEIVGQLQACQKQIVQDRAGV